MQIGQGKWGVVRPDLVAASLVFWPYADAEGLHLPVYSIGWTLDCEMFFYLAFALGLPFRRPLGLAARRRRAARPRARSAPLVTLPQPLRFLANPILIDFLLGMGLGTPLPRWAPHRPAPRLPRPLCSPRRSSSAATLAGFNAIPNVPEPVPALDRLGHPGGAALRRNRAARRAARPRARAPPLLRLGDASYALYLVHVLVIIGMRPLLPWMAARMPGHETLAAAIELGLTAAAALALALLVHHGFERPVDRFLRGPRFAPPRIPRPSTAEAR